MRRAIRFLDEEAVTALESIAGSVDELCSLGYALTNTRLTDRAMILLIKDTTQAAICG